VRLASTSRSCGPLDRLLYGVLCGVWALPLPLSLTSLAPLSAAPASQEVTVRVEEGLVNLSRAELRVVGVGTPRLLSPTGGLAKEELGQVARRDLLRRIIHLQERLQGGDEGGGLTPCAPSELKKTISQVRPLRFSDGSVHLPLTLPLKALWCVQSPQSSQNSQGKGVAQPTAPALGRRFALTLRHPLPHTLGERPRLFGEGAPAPHSLHLTYINVSGAMASPPEGAVAVSATPHPQRQGAYLITSREGAPLTLTPHDELWVWLSAPAP
jgi:hypothetical protein